MSDTTRLGVQISATDLASSSIRQLQATIKGLEQSITQLATLSVNASGVTAASIQRETDAIKAKVAALREELALKEQSSAKGIAAAQAEAAYINRDMDLRLRKVQELLTARNALARQEESSAQAASRFEAEQINKSMALREASVRDAIRLNNIRVEAERKAEEIAARAEAEYIQRSLIAREAAARAEASYINRDRGLATSQTRSSASYENQDRDLIAAKQRAEAEYINTSMALEASKARAEAEYNNQNLELIRAKERAEAQYINRGMTEAAAKARAEAEYANQQIDLIRAKERAEAEYLNTARNASIARQRAEAEYENANYNLRYDNMRRLADLENAAFNNRSRRPNPVTGDDGAGLLNRESRHVVGLFDSLARGQRGQAISSLGAAARDAGLGIGGLSASMGVLVALVGGAAILRGAENMGKWAVETRAAASATGMSIEKFSALQGALTLIGVKADSADATLRRLSVNLGTALADPTSLAAEAFHNLGISQDMLAKNGTDTAGVLGLLADAFVKTADGANKSAAMNEIFGHGFERIIPALQKGRDGLQQLEDKAKELGITLTNETAAKLEHTAEQVETLSAKIRGDAISAFTSWGPVIESVIEPLGRLLDVLLKITGKIGAVASFIASIPGRAGSALTSPIFDEASNSYVGAPPGSGRGYKGPFAPRGQEYFNPEGEAGEAPGPRRPPGSIPVPPLVRGASVEETMRHDMAQAGFAAEQKSGDARSARINATKAEIGVIQQVLQTAQLSAKQRIQIETELANKQSQLRTEELSAGAVAAKQSYADFASAEKLKIAEAQGSSVKIKAIYDEWIAAANEKYKQHASVILAIEREKVQEINRARLSELKEGAREEERGNRLNVLNKRLSELQGPSPIVRGSKEGPQADLAAAASARATAGEIEASAQKLVASYAQIMNAAEKGSDVQRAAASEIISVITQAKTQEVALYLKAAELTQAAANKMAAPFTKFFDSVGSQFQSFTHSALQSLLSPQTQLIKAGLTTIKTSLGGSELRQAAKTLFLGIVNDFASSVETAIGHTIAQAISGGAANTIGDLLGQTFSKLLGNVVGGAAGSAVGGAAGQAAGGALGGAEVVGAIATASSAQVTGISTAIATGSSLQVTAIETAALSIVGAITTAATSEDALLTAVAVKPEVLGFSYASGGIVPSAAGGMIVGGTGGTLAILHAKEMVLPAPISQAVQQMAQRGGGSGGTNNNASLNYSPTINTASRGRGGTGMSRSEFGQLLALHSGAMLGEARSMLRTGWRPA